MKAVDIPTKFPRAFGSSAGPSFIRPIPTLSQIGIQDGAASLETGFPPLNFTPVSAGGVPPFGQDFNGVLFQSTAWNRWQNAGGVVQYDSAFSAAVGGYPKGTVLANADWTFFWLSLVDDNVTNPDAAGAGWRILTKRVLAADLTVYVATSGNNANAGTIGSPWATIQYAYDWLRANVDPGPFNMFIQCADGTYGAGVQMGTYGAGAGTVNKDQITILGNLSTPATCIVSASALTGCFQSVAGGRLNVRGFKMTNAGGPALYAYMGGEIRFDTCDFGACPGGTNAYHVAADFGSRILVGGNYTISGGAIAHYAASANSVVQNGSALTVTLSGTPAFSQAFAFAIALGGLNLPLITYTGAATGARYSAGLNAVIQTLGGGANYFPGNSAGSASTGGQYA